MKIDKTDQEIINLLLGNAKLSFRKLAKKAGVSVATAMNRVKRLEKEGIIKGYSAELDYEKLGYEFDAIVEVRVSHGKLYEVEEKISQNPNVTAIYDATGEFDITLICKFKNRRQLNNFVKSLQTIKYVERTLTKLVLKTIKEKAIKV